MTKIKLEVIDSFKGLIKAPDFCPYFREITQEYVGKGSTLTPDINNNDPIRIVNASLCNLCKLCTFVHDGEDIIVSNEDIEKVKKAITAYQPLMESLMKQSYYLQRNERIPIAAFLSFETLQEIIEPLFPEPYRAKVLSYIVSIETPICIIAGMPLYFNRKLTKSAVQVVGEVEWQ
jgi:hypothetical protein